MSTHSTKSLVCPVCDIAQQGDLASIEAHVDAHFDNPTHTLDKSTTQPDPHSTFTIECDAVGCGVIVHLDDMAEHMDRHLAEQLQQGETELASSLKRPLEEDNHVQHRREKNFFASPSIMRSESLEQRRIGQTTMDGFLNSTTTTSTPLSTQFTFVADKFPVSGTFSLLSKAKMLLATSRLQGVTKVAYLADPSVAFFQGDKSDWGWGCGYRNIQMMLSYVVQQQRCSTSSSSHSYSDTPSSFSRSSFHSDPPIIPTIPQIQQQLEYAWSLGFDTMGAQQLGHKVEGTKKWIGTTEAWSVLSSLGIRCHVLDFHMPTGSGGTHPAMLTAVYNYFRDPPWKPLSPPTSIELPPIELPTEDHRPSRIVQTKKPPLYMQHQGHSKTIVGIEILENGVANLLVFDPGRWLHKAIPDLQMESLSQSREGLDGSSAKAESGLWNAQYLLKAFRFQMHSRNSKSQYQLLGISGLYLDPASIAGPISGGRNSVVLELLKRNASLSIGWDDQEYESSKDVVSIRVP
ncbi:hypothetical protein BG004_004322 [Podila humilis]|nr:hypothetical protein BG004_004322 [Podila humilis]